MVANVDRQADLIAAAELMIRSLFGRKAAASGVKAAQDEVTRRILGALGGDEAQRGFDGAPSSIHSDAGVSRIWLSAEFTLPLFALAAEDFCDRLSPTGKGFIRCHVAADDDAFFGIRLVSVTTDDSDAGRDHQFALYALAGTKHYLDTTAGMHAVHDLVAKRLSALDTKPW